jgi:alpha-maltose-1-phosphate synthase
MRIAHLLRKYNPAEWGGTETVIQQLFEGLRKHGAESIVYCPRLETNGSASGAPVNGNGPNGKPAHPATNGHHVADPLADAGCFVRRFNACVPVWGLSDEQRRQILSVGGNLMSFDLLHSLWTTPRLSIIHSHALGRVGGIGLTVARWRKIPFVITVHGGVYDLPTELKRAFAANSSRGIEWGKAFGVLLRARRVLEEADAIITCNPREAAMIREKHPDRRVLVQPHGVRAEVYATDHREAALAAFPRLQGRDVLLSLGRIDAVKNQGWLVEQMRALVQRHPNALLVLAGACTDEAYGRTLEKRIDELGLRNFVLLTGKLPPADPRLIGLMQLARVAILQSISETFGLVILEAWAAGTPAISSRTSGASALIEHGKTGWLFDLNRPEEFHEAVDTVLSNRSAVEQVIAIARARVIAEYDSQVLAARIKNLYTELGEERHALCHSA